MKRTQKLFTLDRAGKYLFAIIWSFFIFMTITNTISNDIQHYDYLMWDISDWFINYEGGFVRRGLPGQILLEFYRIHPYNVRLLILIINIVSSLLLLIIICRMFNRKGWSNAILPLGGCFLWIFMDIWARKDMLLLIITYFIFSHYKKYEEQRNVCSLICFILLSIINILIHEASFFFTIPIMMVYSTTALYNRQQQRITINTFLKQFLPFVPAVITMTLVCLFKGDRQLPKTIWHSWFEVFQAYPDSAHTMSELQQKIGDGVGALSWKTIETMKFHLRVNSVGGLPTDDYIYMAVSIILWIWMMLGNYYVVTRLNTVYFRKEPMAQHTELEISNTLLTQFLFMLPMFTILSCDFGRTIPYWIFTSLMAVYFFGKLDIKTLDKITYCLQKPFSHPLLNNKLVYCFLVMSIPIVRYWTAAGCLQVEIICKIAHHIID